MQETKKDEDKSRKPVTEGASGVGGTSGTPRTNNSSSKPEEDAMETDEDWKKVIPPVRDVLGNLFGVH